MGVDLFAFVMEVEETFGVRILDEVEEMMTAGDLHAFLVEQRDQTLNEGCLSSSTFYRIRQALCAQTGLARREIAPASPLETLLPAQVRRQRWDDLQVAVLPLRLPGLAPPLWWVVSVLAWSLFGMIGLCCPGLFEIGRTKEVIICVSLTWVLILALLIGITRMLRTRLPWGASTMRDLVHVVIGRNADAARAALRRLSDRDIWEQLRQTIGRHFGIDPSRISPEFDFASGRVPG